MLHIIESSIFASPAQTLVNTVNTVGVMGKGIAQAFKAKYPAMFREYKALCDKRILKIGALHCWHGPDRWVLNFPTKTTWKKPSKMEYVERGLTTFREYYKEMGIQSVSFPPLGCGNGQLNWEDVRPMMFHYLKNIEIPVFIHEWFQPTGVAEHRGARLAPVSYGEFLNDLHAVIDERDGRFQTLVRRVDYVVRWTGEGDLIVYLDGKFIIPAEVIGHAWAGLQIGLLTAETLGGELDKVARYLIPVIAALPYVSKVPIQVDVRSREHSRYGLFIDQHATRYDTYTVRAGQDRQPCLFP